MCENRFVPNIAVPEIGKRCHVFILDTRLKKLQIHQDNVYVQLHLISLYTDGPIGKSILANMMKEICVNGDTEGRKTNLSLWVGLVSFKPVAQQNYLGEVGLFID